MVKLLPQKGYRELFRISILVKAVDGLIEASAGIFIYFAGHTATTKALFFLFHQEIAESPRDPFWQYFIDQWHAIAFSSHTFWGLLFMLHGATKLALSAALLQGKIWAYPAAAAIFTLFVAYEAYALTNHPSLFLWLITIFDALVVGLIFREYRRVKKIEIG
jgi:uncharacterized membrane protein